MTIIEQIKAEIDKRYAEYREKMKSDDFTYYEGMADALDLFEQFLDTLESEKPMNQEGFSKEFDDYFLPKNSEQKGRWGFADIFSIARHFAQWGADHTPLPEDTVLFNKGVEEGKRLMMEEAVEARVVELGLGDTPHIILGLSDEFKKGDKVRVIVIPNTDEK